MKCKSSISSNCEFFCDNVKIQHIVVGVIACTCLWLHSCNVEISVDGVAIGAIINEGTAEERDADIVKRDVEIEVLFGGIFNGEKVLTLRELKEAIKSIG